jgi:hypothetical protein
MEERRACVMARYTEDLLLQDGKATTYMTEAGFDDDGSIIFAATILSSDICRALTAKERVDILNFTIKKLTEWRSELRKEELIEELADVK